MRKVFSVTLSNFITRSEFEQVNSAFVAYADRFMDTSDSRYVFQHGAAFYHDKNSYMAAWQISNPHAGVLPGTNLIILAAGIYSELLSSGLPGLTSRIGEYKNNLFSLECAVEVTPWKLSGFGIAKPTVQPVLRANILGKDRNTFVGMPNFAEYSIGREHGEIPVRYNLIGMEFVKLESLVDLSPSANRLQSPSATRKQFS